MPAMITIFNGRQRGLGEETTRIYAQMDVEMRQHLHILKGAPLAVFLAISLHANEHGWAWPSRDLLARETGYNKNTVSDAIARLCGNDKHDPITIDGHRLMLRYQPQDGNSGEFDSAHYLIFPTPKQVAQYENSQLELPCTGFPVTVKPVTVEPVTVNPYTKENHIKEEPEDKEEPGEKKEDSSSVFCSIHNVEMQLCTAKDGSGETWYAHRVNGTWCKGASRDLPTKPVDGRRYIEGEYAEFIDH
jgi:hypothetical protein